jgi:hypothetical protein
MVVSLGIPYCDSDRVSYHHIRSVGPNWPEGGEIDVVEGVHEQTVNQATLHTSEGCTTTANGKVAGKILGKQCASSGSDNSGCGFLDSDTRTYGHGFNMERGGVFAHLWTSSGIKVWAFSREEIPADIQQKKPNPDSWPAPMASWASDSCNIDSHFHDHVLTIDTTLCGDFAGATYNSAGCPGTCADAVADPSNFKRELLPPYALVHRVLNLFASRRQMDD